MTFTEAGIALGPGTLVLPIEKIAHGGQGLAFAGGGTRIHTLLAAAYGRAFAPTAVLKIQQATAYWNQGQKALAQIHLALLGLPRLDEPGAHRLFLADLALERGTSAQDVMKALGLDPALLGLEKYNPNQPRVPAGNGRESGHWGSGGGGNSRKTFAQRAEVRVKGRSASRGDPGSQNIQAPQLLILTPQALKHILTLHGAGTPDTKKGKFTPQYSTEDQVRDLVQKAWEQATPEDIAMGSPTDRAVIAASMSVIVNDEIRPEIIGNSGTGLRVPSIPTNTYVVVIDSNRKVITCYPINPEDEINPRDE
jgi:hypothetical protein